MTKHERIIAVASLLEGGLLAYIGGLRLLAAIVAVDIVWFCIVSPTKLKE